jgi:hypothetical protein
MFDKNPIKIPIGPLKKGKKYYPRKEDVKKSLHIESNSSKFDTIQDPLFE